MKKLCFFSLFLFIFSLQHSFSQIEIYANERDRQNRNNPNSFSQRNNLLLPSVDATARYIQGRGKVDIYLLAESENNGNAGIFARAGKAY